MVTTSSDVPAGKGGEDHVVVVTGNSSGIGAAIEGRLLAAGWFVVGVDLQPATSARLTTVEGHRRQQIIGDVAERSTHAEAVELARQNGRLTGWVNNAAVAVPGNLHDINEGDVARTFEVNLQGYYWGCAAAITEFVGSRTIGSLVNISSIQAQTAFPGWAAYVAAKGGVEALTRYIAVEYGPVGIRANAVAPGNIRTPLAQEVIDRGADRDRMANLFNSMQPMNRMGEPDEVAEVVEFLISSRASFLSGQIINVDGAATARCFPMDADPQLLTRFRDASAVLNEPRSGGRDDLR